MGGSACAGDSLTYLRPIYRCEPTPGKGVFVVALDPREAWFVLDRGWATLDGVRYRCNQDGWDADLDMEGRMTVRCEIDVRGCLTHADALVDLRGPLVQVA